MPPGLKAALRALCSNVCENVSLVNDREYITRICRSAVYLLTEVLELSSNWSSDDSRGRIVPHDIRLSTHMDDELQNLFLFCKVYWYGSD